MEAALTRVLVAWVDAVRARARAVVLLGAVTTLALAAYAVGHLGMNTRHTALLSEDLPFWQQYNEFASVFPILDEALLVVVDADTPGQARDASAALAERLESQPERFRDVYIPGGGAFFEREALLYLSVDELHQLSDQLATMQPFLAQIVEDRSLAGLARVVQNGIEQLGAHSDVKIDLRLAFDTLGRAVRAVLEGQGRPISWSELILARKLPGESGRRVLIVDPVLDYDRVLPALRAMDAVRQAAREIGLVPDRGYGVRITGNVALNTEEMIQLVQSALISVGGSFVVVALLVIVAMRSVRIVAWVLATLVAGLIWTAAFAAAAVGHVNVVSIAFAIFFVGLVVDFGIHFAMRYAELLRNQATRAEALPQTTRSIGVSLVLCAGTTAIGFLVFVPTDYKAVAELGLISGVGMLIGLFATLTLLPALLELWPPGDPSRVRTGASWIERVLIHVATQHPSAVGRTALGLALASLAALPYARFDHNVVAMRDPDTESARTFAELLAESDTSPWTIDVLEPDLASAQRVAARLRALAVVERAVTLADYVPEDQDEKLAILADLGYFVPPPPQDDAAPEVPVREQIAALEALRASLDAPWLASDPNHAESARAAAAQLDRFLARLRPLGSAQRQELARFERSLTGALPEQLRRLWRSLEPTPVAIGDLPAPLVRRMLSSQGQARVEVLPREDLANNEAHARFVDGVRAVAPGATGSAVTLLEWGRAVVRSFREALALSTLAIALLLWLLWRSLRYMAIALAPLALSALVLTATAVLLDIPFNFGNVIVLPLLLGIGVDSGIHLVQRHRDAREHGENAETEQELLETSTAQAILYSALTTMASFGSLAFSSHVGFATMGQLLLIGVTFTLAANLLLVPALLARERPARAPAPVRQPA